MNPVVFNRKGSALLQDLIRRAKGRSLVLNLFRLFEKFFKAETATKIGGIAPREPMEEKSPSVSARILCVLRALCGGSLERRHFSIPYSRILLKRAGWLISRILEAWERFPPVFFSARRIKSASRRRVAFLTDSSSLKRKSGGG